MSEKEKKGSRKKPRKVKLEEKRQVMVATTTDGAVVPLMSGREISDYLGVGRSTLRRLVANGLIPSIKVGGLRKFDVLAVRAALDRNS
jgi:excisionase family DNA binding protein